MPTLLYSPYIIIDFIVDKPWVSKTRPVCPIQFPVRLVSFLTFKKRQVSFQVWLLVWDQAVVFRHWTTSGHQMLQDKTVTVKEKTGRDSPQDGVQVGGAKFQIQSQGGLVKYQT